MIEKKIKSINPKNNVKIRSWDIPSLNDIEFIISKTAQAQMIWSEVNLLSRLNLLKNLAHIINERSNELSALMADEMGKPIKQGIGELHKCVWLCDYYLDNSKQVLSDKYIETGFFMKVLLPIAQ